MLLLELQSNEDAAIGVILSAEVLGRRTEVETSRYNERNTESRVTGRPYSVKAPRGVPQMHAR